MEGGSSRSEVGVCSMRRGDDGERGRTLEAKGKRRSQVLHVWLHLEFGTLMEAFAGSRDALMVWSFSIRPGPRDVDGEFTMAKMLLELAFEMELGQDIDVVAGSWTD